MFFSETQKEKIIRRYNENAYRRAVSMIDTYTKEWRLEKLELIEHFSENLLFACFSENHGQCVLKIEIYHTYPLEPEVCVLRLYNGQGYCRIYEFSPEDKVCLLERILPGDTIYNFDEISQIDRVNFFVDLYERLYMPALEIPNLSMFPSYLNRLEKVEAGIGHRDDCQNIIPHIKKAKEIILSVNSAYNRKTLIHGDLHHRNIIKNQTGGHTAIDPSGIADDPVFDVSCFILYEFGYQLAGKPIKEFLEFIDLFSQRLRIPANILKKCLYAELVIQLFRGVAAGTSKEEWTGDIWNIEVAEQMINASL